MTTNIEGKNVARLRKAAGLTQQGLADLIADLVAEDTGNRPDADKSYISGVENGRKTLTNKKET